MVKPKNVRNVLKKLTINDSLTQQPLEVVGRLSLGQVTEFENVLEGLQLTDCFLIGSCLPESFMGAEGDTVFLPVSSQSSFQRQIVWSTRRGNKF